SRPLYEDAGPTSSGGFRKGDLRWTLEEPLIPDRRVETRGVTSCLGLSTRRGVRYARIATISVDFLDCSTPPLCICTRESPGRDWRSPDLGRMAAPDPARSPRCIQAGRRPHRLPGPPIRHPCQYGSCRI